ncbi:O-antigen ligase family protein [Flavobacterium sp. SUN052]|uniref:O-antigen ligase family protein n=1 Tax=Flavobacterium sp. SUN052 TaxID=3002441 RepID=UPI00237E424D|nr:O-antigen ligase family protein [Flavobacterium sp. SUN052]MEC4003517.1 O-antigen ligase family protein [Flavobacterium sp. SUN052]
MIGYFFYKKINNFRVFIKTIVLCGFVSAVIHFIVLFSTGEIFSGSVEQVRDFSKDNFLELIAIFFLSYYKKFEGRPLFKFNTNTFFIFIILLLSCVLYFSRTMIIASIIILLSIHGYTYVTTRTIKVLGIVLLLLIGLYAYLFSVKIDRNKPGLETFLYKIKNAPSELFQTKIDRENHKDLWDHWRGYEAKRAFALMEEQPLSYIIGTGQGSLVNLKFEAPLTGENKKGLKLISELHNGYVYIFYKTGLIGLLILVYFLVSIYKKIYIIDNVNKFATVWVSAFGLIFLFTTLTITGIYNSRDIIIFLLGALLYFHKEGNNTIIEQE